MVIKQWVHAAIPRTFTITFQPKKEAWERGRETCHTNRGGGCTLEISVWGCAAGTLEPLAYTRTSSAEFYTRVNSPDPPIYRHC